MPKFTIWTVSWKANRKEREVSCFSKKAAIHKYLDLLDTPASCQISDLKIYKNDIEYTGTLNRFLMR